MSIIYRSEFSTSKSGFSRNICRMIGAVVLALGLASAAAAQERELSLGEARVVAEQALAGGNAGLAEVLARAMLQANDQDAHALVILATAEVAMGKFDAALEHARSGFRLAANPQLKVRAARIAASSRFRAEQYARAEWWLRRASNHAATPQEQQILANEFRSTRARNPWLVTISGWVAPNSNINNGADNDSFTLYLPGAEPGEYFAWPGWTWGAESQPLSGIEVAAGANISYRLNEDASRITRLGFSTFSKTYRLSDESAEAAPDVSGSDFAFNSAELTLFHGRKFAGANGVSQFQFTFGASEHGGRPHTRFSRINLGQSYPISEKSAAELFGSYEDRVDLRGNGADAEIYSVGAGYRRQFADRSTLGVTLQANRTESESSRSRSDTVSVGVNYTLGRPVLGANLSLSARYDSRHYPLPDLLWPGERDDEILTFGATLAFRNVQYLGFSPTISFQQTRTTSSVETFDSRSSSVRFGLESRF